MEWVWNPWGIMGLVDVLIEFSMAAFVFFAAPWQKVNRRLALLLLLQGAWIGGRQGLRLFMGEASDGYAALMVSAVALLAYLCAYLLFLATLNSPLVRPLKAKAGEATLWGLMVVLPIIRVVAAEQFFTGVRRGEVVVWLPNLGPWLAWIPSLTAAVFAFGLVVAISNYLRSPVGTVARKRAKALAVAFGVSDALWALYFLAVIVGGLLQIEDQSSRSIAFLMAAQMIPSLFVFLLGYAILKTQLFDIDLKIKWTLKRGTVAAIFVAVFFVAAQLGQNFLSTRYGWALGGIAAGLLLFAIAPLQRAAERLADRTMPNVSTSPDYLAFRKLEVYRAAVESALEEGGISLKERAILQRMQAKLGLAPADATAVEADVRDVLAPRPRRSGASA